MVTQYCPKTPLRSFQAASGFIYPKYRSGHPEILFSLPKKIFPGSKYAIILFNFESRRTAGGESMVQAEKRRHRFADRDRSDGHVQRNRYRRPVFIYLPVYWLGHPGNLLFSLSQKIFLDESIQILYLFLETAALQKRCTCPT